MSPAIKNPQEVHDMMFDCTDTNSDGHISIEEFGDYFKTLGHDITEEEMKHPFDTINSDVNGEISREEFVAALHQLNFTLVWKRPSCQMRYTEIAALLTI